MVHCHRGPVGGHEIGGRGTPPGPGLEKGGVT